MLIVMNCIRVFDEQVASFEDFDSLYSTSFTWTAGIEPGESAVNHLQPPPLFTLLSSL